MKKQRETNADALQLGDQHLGHRARAKEVCAHSGFLEAHFMGEMLILRQLADKRADEREIGGGGGADGHQKVTSA